jgi:hypothetical protein
MPPELILIYPLGSYVLMSNIKVKVTYDNFCASLHIIPLSHMRKCRQDFMHSNVGSMNMMVLFTLCTCFAKRLTENRISREPLISSLQILKHLSSCTDSEWESNLNGPVHNWPLHWLSYPFVTVAHFILLIRLESIHLYSLAISHFNSCYLCKL